MTKRQGLLETERIREIQGQLAGFLLEEVVDPNGEFYYDGSNLRVCPDSGFGVVHIVVHIRNRRVSS